MLQNTFTQLVTQYSNDKALIDHLWQEIAANYSEEGRHYHTLTHLESLLEQLTEVKDEIRDWNTILFTLFYHDLIYDASRSDNEEKSAELAAVRMRSLGVPEEMIEHCSEQILATKLHQALTDTDTNLFTDADLSILGKENEVYRQYAANVRKEYAIYPDELYNPGRKKVLEHFLLMERIFKTEHFFRKFETSARENLAWEITFLEQAV